MNYNYNKILVVGLVVATAIFAILTIYISFREKPAKQAPAPTTIVQPIPTSPVVSTSSETIENCLMTKKSDAIVEAVGKVDDKTVGIFWGNIENIQIKDGNISLTIISIDGKQLQSFKFPDREQLFYDTQKLQYLKSSDLKIGHTLFLSFECNPKAEDKKPYFTRIAITGKVFGD